MLARHLAFCATEIEQHITTATMDHAELRAKVHEYFRAQLDDAKVRISRQGPLTQSQKDSYKTSLSLMEEGNGTFWQILGSDFEQAELDNFFRATGLPREQYRDVTPVVLDEIRKARIGAYTAALAYAEGLDAYDFTETLSGSHSASELPSGATTPYPSISASVEAFFRVHEKSSGWTSSTLEKRQAILDIAIEWFGADTSMADISKRDAAALKEALLSLPVNRSKSPRLRGLTLRDALAVEDITKISNSTVNAYLSVFRIFWDWAEKHDYAPDALFQNLSVGKKGHGAKERGPFDQEALAKAYTALTDPGTKYYRKKSHRWATLIAMFSGARLNEVCQLHVSDIARVEDFWVFDFNDEGDKRLKSPAAKRQVPIHSHLIELGILGYREEQASHGHERLFPDYVHHEKHGYGDSLSKWFNRTFTSGLGIKSEAHVFHGLRHTFATRLGQADVPTERIQFIIGHEREGVTHQVYMKDGYSLRQSQDAVERFAIHGPDMHG